LPIAFELNNVYNLINIKEIKKTKGVTEMFKKGDFVKVVVISEFGRVGQIVDDGIVSAPTLDGVKVCDYKVYFPETEHGTIAETINVPSIWLEKTTKAEYQERIDRGKERNRLADEQAKMFDEMFPGLFGPSEGS
jgi:hypothetical protein